MSEEMFDQEKLEKAMQTARDEQVKLLEKVKRGENGA